MNFNDINVIKNEGFVGFETISELMMTSCRNVPKKKGVYFVLNTSNSPPHFLSGSVGGHFKGENPTVSINELESNWVNETIVIYIGKAGGSNSSATLQSRLRQYMRFGQGEPVGHWGGRLIWQIQGIHDYQIFWKPILSEEPRDIEKRLIQGFISIYKKRPFANLTV